ncbi:MAG TPA: penicillin-binding protein activator LpoB [Thermodesulfobacteriaceae bacterium]|nr:penicillin-binding protein activator LpoB [Thermodesulfobacteriaceae bacterium]
MAGSKPSIGVAEFRNTAHASWWRTGMGWDLAGMVSNELSSLGHFRVVERSKLKHVLREQDLGASGRVRKSTAAKMGRLTGAQYLVMGTVTSYEERTSGVGGGFSFGPIRLGGKKDKAYISVDLRVVDTTTGEIVHSRSIEANSSGGGVDVGLHFGGFRSQMGGFAKTPAGKAIRACVMEIVDYLDCVMIKKDSCVDEFDLKEQKRKAKTKSAISLDE